MKLLNPTLIQLGASFLVGTLLGLFFSFNINLICSVVGVSLVIQFFYFFIHFKSVHPNYTFTYLSLFSFFCIGFLNANLHQPPLQQLHFMHSVKDSEVIEFSGNISEVLNPSTKFNNYIVSLDRVNNTDSKGKLLLRITKDTLFNLLPNDFVVGSAQLYALQVKRNTEGFDYASYMQNQGVYFQANIRQASSIQHFPSSTFSFSRFAHTWRKRIKDLLRINGVQENHSQLTQALVLGQKKEIDKKLYQEFADAGVIHILAVSGMHVGIVLMLLQFVLSPLLRLRFGSVIRTVLVLILLWLFALMAGFSPSVTRAVCMFSFFAVALNLKRKTNTLNLLFASVFPLLLLRPNLLLEVGFQLSYAAVFAIVVVYPVIQKWYQPRFYIDKLLWSIVGVSLCAQLGVLPFSLYYFHQFPGLFLFANVVILPFLAILLGTCILVVLWCIFGFTLPNFIIIIHAFLLDSLTAFVSKIASYQEFVWRGIYFDQWMFIGAILGGYFVMVSFRKTSFGNVVAAMLSYIFVAIAYYSGNSLRLQQEEFFVFQQPRQHLLGFQKAGGFWVSSNSILDSLPSPWSVKNIKNERNLSLYFYNQKAPIYQLNNNEYLFIVNREAIYEIPNFQPTYVLLTDSPPVHLERLIKQLQPKQIIADGNNYASFVVRWKETCEKMGVAFHSTYESGDWRLVIE